MTDKTEVGAKPRTCGECAGMPDADFADGKAINRRCFCQRVFRQPTEFDAEDGEALLGWEA